MTFYSHHFLIPIRTSFHLLFVTRHGECFALKQGQVYRILSYFLSFKNFVHPGFLALSNTFSWLRRGDVVPILKSWPVLSCRWSGVISSFSQLFTQLCFYSSLKPRQVPCHTLCCRCRCQLYSLIVALTMKAGSGLGGVHSLKASSSQQCLCLVSGCRT